MKVYAFPRAQTAFFLKHVEDATPIGEVCRKANMSYATFYNWRKKSGPSALGDKAPAAA